MIISSSLDFPLIPWTSISRFCKSLTAILPTPPVTPETKTGLSKDISLSINFLTEAAAVKPAVPISIALSKESPSGSFTIQFEGRATSWPKPPFTLMPNL